MTTRHALVLALGAVCSLTAIDGQASCWKLITEPSCCAWNQRPLTINCGSTTCSDVIKSNPSYPRGVPVEPMQTGQKDHIPDGFVYCEYYAVGCKEHLNPPACFWSTLVFSPSCQKSAVSGDGCVGQ